MDSFRLARAAPPPLRIAAVVAASVILSLQGSPESAEVDFQADVLPILSRKCFRCHAGDKPEGNLSLADRAAMLQGGDSGPAVVPNDAARSLLLARVTAADPDEAMPPEGERLSDAEIATLRAWIDRGAEWKDPEPYPLALAEVVVPPGVGTPLDRLLADYFRRQGIAAPAVVSDEIFARRTALDLVGRPLAAADLVVFLADDAADKRARLVDALLADQEGFVDHWLTFWGDHLRFGSDMAAGIFDDGPAAKTSMQSLRTKLVGSPPLDRFARELVTQQMVPTYAPPGEVLSAVDGPEMQEAATVAHVFLGMQLKCASCHDSFLDRWKQADAWGLAAALGSGRMPVDRCDLPTGRIAESAFPLRDLGAIDPGADAKQRRARVAELLTTPQNGLFARTFVNRVWARLFGRGLIEPLDEMMEHAPWDAAVLDWLAADFVSHGYDVRHLLRRIMTSEAYAAAAVEDTPLEAGRPYVFQGPEVRRLSAEQFIDAIGRLGNNLPRAWTRPNDPLMTTLGRPSRDVVVTARTEEATTLLALELINGPAVGGLIDTAAAATADLPGEQAIERVFLTLLGRRPTAKELAACPPRTAETSAKRQIGDLIWSTTMLPEFQLIR
ncbi:MAG: DUF1553 domain-containing protein [Planctomycetia bacterium]